MPEESMCDKNINSLEVSRFSHPVFEKVYLKTQKKFLKVIKFFYFLLRHHIELSYSFCTRFIFMGNDGTCEEGNSSIQPGGTAIKLNKDVEFKVVKHEKILT